jgi:hypothetical protein
LATSLSRSADIWSCNFRSAAAFAWLAFFNSFWAFCSAATFALLAATLAATFALSACWSWRFKRLLWSFDPCVADAE